MQTDVKVLDCRLYIEGNHDSDIETHMWYINTDQIFMCWDEVIGETL